MIGLGTLFNVAGILIGGFLGIFCKKRITERIQETLLKANGVCVLFLGIFAHIHIRKDTDKGKRKLRYATSVLMLWSDLFDIYNYIAIPRLIVDVSYFQMLPISGYDTTKYLCVIVALQGRVIRIGKWYAVDLKCLGGMSLCGHRDKIFYIPLNCHISSFFVCGYNVLVHINLTCNNDTTHQQGHHKPKGTDA